MEYCFHVSVDLYSNSLCLIIILNIQFIITFCEDLADRVLWREKKSETKLTANILKQEPNTQTVKKNTDLNGTTQNHAIGGGGQTPFSQQQCDR